MGKEFRYAIIRSLPVMCGYVFLGIAFGIVLQQAGYNFIWAFAISLFVYAGSMQFVMVPLLASAASPVTMAATALFVNSRHLFYGLSFVESLKKMKTRRRSTGRPGFSSHCWISATGLPALSSAHCSARSFPLTLRALIFP